ncbi:MAG: hypothetical protein JJT89_01835 [Nitriliruptoraceae bacterium]|nr:hypothetical protein [Nitriliruptoraceae bacterium]
MIEVLAAVLVFVTVGLLWGIKQTLESIQDDLQELRTELRQGSGTGDRDDAERPG